VVTDYAAGELFQILEDDGNLPEEQVYSFKNYRKTRLIELQQMSNFLSPC